MPLNCLMLGMLAGLSVSQAVTAQPIAQPVPSRSGAPVADQFAQSAAEPTDQINHANPAASDHPDGASSLNHLDLDPDLIEESPVLRRWLQQVPDVWSDIRRDPSFRTRLRFGYANFPSSQDASGISVGIEDVFINRSPITVSADYQRSFNGDRQSYGVDLHYYALPLGSYVNVAPVVGYRSVKGEGYDIDGVNVGARLLLALSRTGAADISVTQSWVAPGSHEEVGITTLSLGYAITHDLRISTDLQQQNAPRQKDNRVGVSLEWMLR